MINKKFREQFYKAYVKAFDTMNPLPYSDSVTTRILYALMVASGKILAVNSYRGITSKQTSIEATTMENPERKRFLEEHNKYAKKISKSLSAPTIENVKKHLEKQSIDYITITSFNDTYIVLEDFTAIGLSDNGDRILYYFLNTEEKIPTWFDECVVYSPKETRETYKYVVRGAHGFSTKNLDIKDLNVDIDLNYNDDIPDEPIKKFLMGDDAGVVILHGEPGTGKSTYIRHLISNVEKDFLYLDASCFDFLTDASFIELLFENKNSIIILEDAEKVLQKREHNMGNRLISPLLNLTDGLLADSLKLKVLCTFNAKMNEIDPAILRKGRLKIKYQFDKLNKVKTSKLFKKLGIEGVEEKPQTLADIYNYAEKADYDNNTKRSVGF